MLVKSKFSHAPPHVARFFGGVSKAAKKKKQRLEVGLMPTSSQKLNVKNLAVDIDSSLLFRALHDFRHCAFGVSKIGSLVEPAPIRFGGSFSLYYTTVGNGTSAVVQLWKDQELMFTGGTASLFVYAMEYAPTAVKLVLRAAREHYVGGDYSRLDLDRALEDYRRARRYSKGTDEWTKIWQQQKLEEHLPVAKFWHDNPNSDKAVHYGSGPFTGTSQWGLAHHEIICVDPLACTTKPGDLAFVKSSIEVLEPVNYTSCDIFSDASVGAMGFECIANQQKWVDQIAKTADTIPYTDAYLKLSLCEPVKIHGRLRHKARPHNAEVIWEVDPGGANFLDVQASLSEKAIEANEVRMRWFFNVVRPPRGRKKNFFTKDMVERIRRRHGIIEPLPGNLPKIRVNRTKLLAQKLEGLRPQARERAWKLACKKPPEELHLGAPYHCLLPRGMLRRGPFYAIDPGIGPTDMSMRSIITSCHRYGITVTYGKEGWFVC